MGVIDFGRFARIVKRCAEVAGEPGIDASVGSVYHGVLEGSAGTYLAADTTVTTAVSTYRKDKKEAAQALVAFDMPYRVARSTVMAFVPGILLPETLKAQKTDTDKVSAVEALLAALGQHAGESWADTLVQGDFGQKASATLKVVKQATASNLALSHAREDRQAAYLDAYPRYIQFKSVVRDACGSKSKEYKRIHIRDDGDKTPDPAAATTPSTTATPAPTAAPVTTPPSTTAAPATP